MTAFGAVKDDQSCRETVKFSLVYCKPIFKFRENVAWFASKMGKVGAVILNNGDGSRGRQTELYYSVELPRPGREVGTIGENRMLHSSWAV